MGAVLDLVATQTSYAMSVSSLSSEHHVGNPREQDERFLASHAAPTGSRESGKPKTKGELELLRKCRSFHRMALKRVEDGKIGQIYSAISAFYGSNSPVERHGSGGFGHDRLVMHVNQLYPIAKLGMAGLTTKVPESIAVPRRPVFATRAKAMTAALRYNGREERWDVEVRSALLNALTLPYATMKFGKTKDGLAWWENCEFLSVLGDPTLEKFEPLKGRWVMHEFWKSIAAMEESGLYRQPVIDKLSATWKEKHGGGKGFYPDTMMVKIREHYKKNKKGDIKLIVESEGSDMLLRDPDDFDDINGFPFRWLIFAEHIRGYWPLAEPQLYLDQMAETDFLRSKGLVNAQRANLRIILNQSLLSKAEGERMNSSEPMVIVAAKGNPENAASVLDTTKNTTPAYTEQEVRAGADIRRIAGQGGGGQELPSTPSVSATEAAIEQQNALARGTDREQQTALWLGDLAKASGNIMQKNLDRKIEEKITGERDVIRIDNKQDIEGDFDYETYVHNALTEDPASIRAKMKELFELTKTYPNGNIDHAFKVMLQDGYNRHDVDEWVLPPEPPPEPAPPPDAGLGGMDPGALLPPGTLPTELNVAPPPGPITGAQTPFLPPDALGPGGILGSNLQTDVGGAAQGLAPGDFGALARSLAV